MSPHHTKLEFRTWLYIECLVPFLIVLIIIPASILFHKPEWAKFIHLSFEVLAGGELPAVAFCMLLPTLVMGIQHEASTGSLLAVLCGGFLAFATYCACKLEPLDIRGDPLAELVLIRSAMSIALMLSTTYLAIQVRKVALADAVAGSQT
jgi:hypothetical protein